MFCLLSIYLSTTIDVEVGITVELCGDVRKALTVGRCTIGVSLRYPRPCHRFSVIAILLAWLDVLSPGTYAPDLAAPSVFPSSYWPCVVMGNHHVDTSSIFFTQLPFSNFPAFTRACYQRHPHNRNSCSLHCATNQHLNT